MAADLDEFFATFVVDAMMRIDASAERVWDLISDVTRMPEFSPECTKVEWVGGATAPAAGARFDGTSRAGAFEWTRTCTITELDEPSVFAYDVADVTGEAAQSRWRFEIEPDGNATIVRQRFSHVPTGRSTVRIMAEGDPEAAEEIIAERAEMLREAMQRTLEAMRETLERPREAGRP